MSKKGNLVVRGIKKYVGKGKNETAYNFECVWDFTAYSKVDDYAKQCQELEGVDKHYAVLLEEKEKYIVATNNLIQKYNPVDEGRMKQYKILHLIKNICKWLCLPLFILSFVIALNGADILWTIPFILGILLSFITIGLVVADVVTRKAIKKAHSAINAEFKKLRDGFRTICMQNYQLIDQIYLSSLSPQERVQEMRLREQERLNKQMLRNQEQMLDLQNDTNYELRKNSIMMQQNNRLLQDIHDNDMKRAARSNL